MEKEYIRLTEIDREILHSFEILIEGLGDYLGHGYEIVLHSLENLEQSVIKIIRGDYSCRSVGAPITDYALNMLALIEKKKHTAPVSYFNRNNNGAVLKSTTIPVLGQKNRVIGLVCINFYTDTPLSLVVENLFPTAINKLPETSKIEDFSGNMDDLIDKALVDAIKIVSTDHNIAMVNKNKEILYILYQKGIFNVKDAVVRIADKLHLSKNTVYMHLRNFSKELKQ